MSKRALSSLDIGKSPIDIASFTKYIKLLYLKTFINEIPNIIFPIELIDIIINLIHITPQHHKIPVSNNHIKLCYLQRHIIIKRVRNVFGVENIQHTKQPYSRCSFKIALKGGYFKKSFILVIYESNKVVVQGNVFTPELYGKINICLDEKINIDY